MPTERIVRVVAGGFVLASLALGATESPLFVSRGFLWLAAFVGANLLQSGFTGFCPLELVLRSAGVPRTLRPGPGPVRRAAFDPLLLAAPPQRHALGIEHCEH
jgi:DUF2892 family protein